MKMSRTDVLEAIRTLSGRCPAHGYGCQDKACPHPRNLPNAVSIDDLVRALGLAEQRAFDRQTAELAPPPAREEFHVSPATVKCDRAGTCSEVTSTVACKECGKVYVRCSNHGGEKGARASLKSHRGLHHPKMSAGRPVAP